MTFSEDVYILCRKVPKGKVTTYKAIAKALGTRAYRQVGQALRKNPDAPRTPCHRVVKSDGSIGGFMGQQSHPKKERLLRQEGVRIQDEKVDPKQIIVRL